MNSVRRFALLPIILSITASTLIGQSAQAQINPELNRQLVKITDPTARIQKLDSVITQELFDIGHGSGTNRPPSGNDVHTLLAMRKNDCLLAKAACSQFPKWTALVCRTDFDAPLPLQHDIWSAVIDSFAPATVDKFLTGMKKCGNSPTRPKLIGSLKLVEILNEKKAVGPAKAAADWIASEWSAPPTSIGAFADVSQTIRTLRNSTPVAFDLMKPLGFMLFKWLKAMPTPKRLDGPYADAIQVSFDTLANAGRGEEYLALAESLMPAAREQKLVDLSLMLTHFTCLVWRETNRIDHCAKALSDLRPIGESDPAIRLLVQADEANNIFYAGNAAEAIVKMEPLLRAAEKSDKTWIVTWNYLGLAFMEIANGQLTQAQEHIDKHLELVRAQKQDHTLALFGRMAKIVVLTDQQKWPEAHKESDALKRQLQTGIRGTPEILARAAWAELVLEARSRNKAGANAAAESLKSYVKELPGLKHLTTLADAVIAATNGSYKPSELDPVRKMLGARNQIVLSAEKEIAAIMAAK